MVVKKEHRIFIAVVGLAVSAMAIDRLMLNSAVSGTPRRANANTPGTTPDITTNQVSSDPSAKPTVSSKKLWNAFEQTQTRQPVEPSVPEETPKGFSADVFRQQHPLSAVMMKGDTGYAIINGQTLRVGEAIDGFKIVAIEKTSVLFESDSNHLKLELGPGTK